MATINRDFKLEALLPCTDNFSRLQGLGKVTLGAGESVEYDWAEGSSNWKLEGLEIRSLTKDVGGNLTSLALSKYSEYLETGTAFTPPPLRTGSSGPAAPACQQVSASSAATYKAGSTNIITLTVVGNLAPDPAMPTIKVKHRLWMYDSAADTWCFVDPEVDIQIPCE